MSSDSPAQAEAYLDPDLPRDQRINDLMGRLTLAEKCGQLLYNAEAIERLGIPEYNWWNECLHGISRAGRATVFPQAIGMAATFDPKLIKQVASVVADEGRAKHHEASRQGNRGIYRGLTFWTPNINIFRDPRWGRGQETYGEDPYLTSQIGIAFVQGLQGDDPSYLKAAACAKHFAVHSGPEKDRHHFDAIANPKDMTETYLPAFKALVDTGVEAVMGAYNRVNGEAACASQTLLVDTLRGAWGFKGHVVSDCWAVRDIHENHKIVNTLAEAAALAVKAGCDLNCGCAYAELNNAIEQGLLTEQDIDRSLRRLLETRFKLGMFDPPERVPFAQTSMGVVNCEKHRELARESAAKSIVLLKNRHGTLPLRQNIKRVLVVGPNASNMDVLMGNYHGISGNMTTILEGICDAAGEGVTVAYRMSCQLDKENSSPVDVIRYDVKQSDIVIAVMGLSPIIEGEEGDTIASPLAGDRDSLGLPDCQRQFIRKITGLGTPVVLVLTGGSAISITEEHELADAVLQVWYPGEQGGAAVADVLFGDVSPSGRLPVTVPNSVDDLPPFDDYSMNGRTYRYATAEPLYPFGFGLSYTTFEYSELALKNVKPKCGYSIALNVEVKNSGAITSDEVVQIYVKVPQGDAPVPKYALAGIQRVSLKPGEQCELSLSIDPQSLATVHADGSARHLEGTYTIWVGGCSPDPRAAALGGASPLSLEFEVRG